MKKQDKSFDHKYKFIQLALLNIAPDEIVPKDDDLTSTPCGKPIQRRMTDKEFREYVLFLSQFLKLEEFELKRIEASTLKSVN